jgi:hypothetical protein
MRGLTRVLLTVNFSLLILLIGPGSSRQLYLTEMKTRDSSYCCLLIAVLVYCFGCFVSGVFCLDSDFQIRREASTATHEAGLGALSRLVPRCFNFFAYMLSCWVWEGEPDHPGDQRSRGWALCISRWRTGSGESTAKCRPRFPNVIADVS